MKMPPNIYSKAFGDKKVTTFLFIASVVVWFLVIFNNKKWKEQQVLKSDVLNYYTYLPALLIDGDFTFSFRKERIVNENNDRILGATMPNERFIPKMSMGMAILYSPFFLIGHFIASISDYPNDGFSLPYALLMIVGHCFYFFLGFFYLRKVLLTLFSAKITLITLLVLALSTNLFYYGVIEIGMSHAYSFCLFSLFMWLTIKWHNLPDFKTTLMLGLLSGLIVLVRPTNIIIVFIFILYRVYNNATFLDKIKLFLQHWLSLLFIVLLAFGVFFLQMLFWKMASGNWLYFSYGHEGFFFNNPKIVEGLFSFRKGWLLYTPVMAIALLAMVLCVKQFKNWGFGIILFSVLNIYIVFSWWCWWYGGSFGSRAMVESYAILAIPLAGMIQLTLKRTTILKVMIFLVLAATTGLNLLQTVQYHHFLHYDSMTKASYMEIFLAKNNFKWPPGYNEKLQKPDYENAILGLEEDFQKVDRKNEINEQINRIKQNKGWFEKIKQQSIERGISLDSALVRNARYILKNKQ